MEVSSKSKRSVSILLLPKDSMETSSIQNRIFLRGLMLTIFIVTK